MKWLVVLFILLTPALSLAQNPHGPATGLSFGNTPLYTGTTAPTSGQAVCNNAGKLGGCAGGGGQGTVTGLINVMLPPYNATGDGVTCDDSAILAAWNAACAAANTGGFSAPTVYFPHPSVTYWTCAPLLLSCAHQIQLDGESELSTYIQNDSDFPTMVLVPSTYAIQSIGTISAASLATGSGAAMNFGAHPWYLNLSDAMVTWNSPGAYPLNGLSQLDVRLFFNDADLTNQGYLFSVAGDPNLTSSTDCVFVGGKGAEAGLCVRPNGALCYQLTTGGTPHQACGGAGAITANTTHEAEMAYNGSDVYVFLDGTQITGSPFAATGTVTQTPFTAITAGATMDGYPDQGNSSLSFIGKMDSYEIAKVARHTSNYTMDTAKFTADSNTLLLLNGKAFNNPLIEADYAYGATDGWLVARGFNGAQGSAPYIRDITIDGGSLGVFEALEPSPKQTNVTYLNQAWIGLELWNNDYEGRFDNIRCTLATGASEACISGSLAQNVEHFSSVQTTIGGYHGIEGFDMGGEILSPFVATGANSQEGIYSNGDNQLFALTVTDLAEDTENGGNPVGVNIIGGGNYQFIGGDLETGATAPCLQVRPINSNFPEGINLIGTRCETDFA